MHTRLKRMAITLGVLALISMGFAALALMDIYKAKETDLYMEWVTVRVSFLLTLMFTLLALVTLVKAEN